LGLVGGFSDNVVVFCICQFLSLGVLQVSRRAFLKFAVPFADSALVVQYRSTASVVRTARDWLIMII